MSLVPRAIKGLRPYSPGRSIEEVQRELGLERVIKLASNENPWGPSPRALEAIQGALSGLNRYPDMTARGLRERLAARFRVKVDNVVVGSGSEGIMAAIMRTFLCSRDEILTAADTFIGFMVLARASGRRLSLIPRGPGQRYDLPAMGRALTPHTKIVYLANPDNPTGTVFTRDEFEAFMALVPPRTLVILDEAYFEFAAGSEGYPDSMHYRYDNVITLRTFSKAYGLAGIRIGYGFAHDELIGNLMKVKLPFEPSALAQAAGTAALEDEAFLRMTLAGTAEVMKTLRGGLTELGQAYLPSRTNFLAVETAGPAACRVLCERLLARGVIVRGLAPFGFPSHFRVTVGTAEENGLFLSALRAALAEIPVSSAAG